MSAPKITLEEVYRVARLARLSPSPEEAQALSQDLSAILNYVALLDAVDTSQVEPTAHAVTVAAVLRPDQLVAEPRSRARAESGPALDRWRLLGAEGAGGGNVIDQTAVEIAEQVRQGKVSASEVAQRFPGAHRAPQPRAQCAAAMWRESEALAQADPRR